MASSKARLLSQEPHDEESADESLVSRSAEATGGSSTLRTLCFAAVGATIVVILMRTGGGSGSSNSATGGGGSIPSQTLVPPLTSIRTGPQFGLRFESTPRPHRDGRGSPHSAAMRRAALHRHPGDEQHTHRIQEAQSDPTSMFDMSTP